MKFCARSFRLFRYSRKRLRRAYWRRAGDASFLLWERLASFPNLWCKPLLRLLGFRTIDRASKALWGYVWLLLSLFQQYCCKYFQNARGVWKVASSLSYSRQLVKGYFHNQINVPKKLPWKPVYFGQYDEASNYCTVSRCNCLISPQHWPEVKVDRNCCNYLQNVWLQIPLCEMKMSSMEQIWAIDFYLKGQNYCFVQLACIINSGIL